MDAPGLVFEFLVEEGTKRIYSTYIFGESSTRSICTEIFIWTSEIMFLKFFWNFLVEAVGVWFKN